jgi:hypothetical protein
MTSPSTAPCENCAHDDDEVVPEMPARRLVPLARLPVAGPIMLCVSIGPNLTTVGSASTSEDLRFVRHGAVALAVSQAAAARANSGAVARVVRAAAQQVIERARLDELRATAETIVGSEAMAKAVITFGASGRTSATIGEVRAATETFAESWVSSTREGRPSLGVQYLMIGSAVLAAILEALAIDEIFVEGSVPRG